MNLLAWLAASLLVLTSCGGDGGSSPEDGGLSGASADAASLAGDGREAVQRFARAYCERGKRCAERLGYGAPWASVAVCADGMARNLARADQVATSCEVSDVEVEPAELAACIEQVQSLSSSRCVVHSMIGLDIRGRAIQPDRFSAPLSTPS